MTTSPGEVLRALIDAYDRGEMTTGAGELLGDGRITDSPMVDAKPADSDAFWR